MGFLCGLHFLLFLHLLHNLSAHPSSLDALLQDYSFKAFVNPRTGVLYDAAAPSNLTGVKLSAVRLRSGSFKKYGVPSLKEFSIPTGVTVKPYVTRLVLVYQNLANYSRLYYPLPGYDYVAPVLGLLAYDAENLSAVNLPELELTALNGPIRIGFPQGAGAKCVSFDSRGEATFKDSVQGTCETDRQGHFSVVVKSVASAPSSPSEGRKKEDTWIIVGAVVGGLVLLGVLVFLVVRCRSYKEEEKIREMERAGEAGEALRMTQVGETRAPTATTTRTQPMLETEYAA